MRKWQRWSEDFEDFAEWMFAATVITGLIVYALGRWLGVFCGC